MLDIDGLDRFTFGDNADLCESLLGLVLAGRKTATCFPLSDVADVGNTEVMPKVGACSVALDWAGTPALVIETTDVKICRFRDVPEAFALAEGENDSLDGWRRDHQSYFERTCGFSPDMELVCEQFRLVSDLRGTT